MHESLFKRGPECALIKTLIAYTNLDALGAPLRFVRSRPAAILQVSTRTIDRLLTKLEKLGWLRRLPQPRLAPGRWGCTTLVWQDWVEREIFLDRTRSFTSASSISAAHRRPASTSDQASKSLPARATVLAHQSVPPTEVINNKPGVAGSSDDCSHIEPPANPHNAASSRRIPETLVAYMHEFQLSPAQVCWLMARAKERGMWLQDVLSFAREGLTRHALLGRPACAWVLSLLSVQKDYAHLAKETSRTRRFQSHKARIHLRTERLSQALFTPGRVLPSGLRIDGTREGLTYCVDASGRLSAMPSQQLLAHLAGGHLSWLRSALRGANDQRGDVAISGHSDSATSRVVALSALRELRASLART